MRLSLILVPFSPDGQVRKADTILILMRSKIGDNVAISCKVSLTSGRLYFILGLAERRAANGYQHQIHRDRIRVPTQSG